MTKPSVGALVWHDLTVENAEGLRDFYAAVVGWSAEDVPMGDYADYAMSTPDGEAVAGVCHARGTNADIPPQWLTYVNVANVDASVRACEAGGGTIVAGPRGLMGGRFCVIRDPAGAVLALFEPPAA